MKRKVYYTEKESNGKKELVSCNTVWNNRVTSEEELDTVVLIIPSTKINPSNKKAKVFIDWDKVRKYTEDLMKYELLEATLFGELKEEAFFVMYKNEEELTAGCCDSYDTAKNLIKELRKNGYKEKFYIKKYEVAS